MLRNQRETENYSKTVLPKALKRLCGRKNSSRQVGTSRYTRTFPSLRFITAVNQPANRAEQINMQLKRTIQTDKFTLAFIKTDGSGFLPMSDLKIPDD